ncbi:MAG: OB-fold nucleic acid binding domain-containing protein [Nanoarchaeota archaeon]
MDTYSSLVDKISKHSRLSVDEVEKKVDAKKSKLSGLISKEGAAQIVAAELGISFENEILKINELSEGLRRANVIGKITSVNLVKEFNKNGRSGKFASFTLGDDTSNVRVVLWDSNHVSLVESGNLAQGSVIEIKGASVKNGEIHVSAFSDIKPSDMKFDSVKETTAPLSGNFGDAKEGAFVSVRAFIVQTFEPRFFDSKKNEGEKGVLFNLVLDDGNATMRSVLFGNNIKKLLGVGDENLFSLDVLNAKRAEIIGEERLFTGSFKMNSFSNNLEFSVREIEEFSIDKVIKELETSAKV